MQWQRQPIENINWINEIANIGNALGKGEVESSSLFDSTIQIRRFPHIFQCFLATATVVGLARKSSIYLEIKG